MSDEVEEWRAVPGFEGRYEVSDWGRVRSLPQVWRQRTRGNGMCTYHKKGQVLRPGSSTAGHLTVMLGRDGGSRSVHALVLQAFVGPAPAGHECRHLDGVETNNRLGNLKWDTRGNNTRDKKWHKGASTYKLKPPQIFEIKRRLATGDFDTQTQMAKEFGVCMSTISAIKHGVFHRDI